MQNREHTDHKLPKVFGPEFGSRYHLHLHDLDGTRTGSMTSSHITVCYTVHLVKICHMLTEATAQQKYIFQIINLKKN